MTMYIGDHETQNKTFATILTFHLHPSLSITARRIEIRLAKLAEGTHLEAMEVEVMLIPRGSVGYHPYTYTSLYLYKDRLSGQPRNSFQNYLVTPSESVLVQGLPQTLGR